MKFIKIDPSDILYNEINKLKNGDYSSYLIFYNETSPYIYQYLLDLAVVNNLSVEEANEILYMLYDEIYKSINTLEDNSDFYYWASQKVMEVARENNYVLIEPTYVEAEAPTVKQKIWTKVSIGIIVTVLIVASGVGIYCLINNKNNSSKDTGSAKIVESKTDEETIIESETDEETTESSTVEIVNENTTEEITEISTEVSTEEDTTEATTEVIPFDDAYMVDYVVIANYYKRFDISYWGENVEYSAATPDRVVTGYELHDLDNDGMQELIISIDVIEPEYVSGRHQLLLTLDANAGIYSAVKSAAVAGDSQFYICDKSDKVYINSDYATKYTYISFDTWQSNGWVSECVFEKNGDDLLTCLWEGNNVTQEEWFEKLESMEKGRKIEDEIFENLKLETPAKAKTVSDALMAYYQNKGVNCTLLESENEYYIIFSKYMSDVWGREAETDKLTSDNYVGREDYIYGLIIRDTESGSYVVSDWFILNSQVDCYEFESARYENEIIVTASGHEFAVEVQGDNFVIVHR